MNWYSEVVKDWSKIPAMVDFYSNELLEARKEVKIYGNVEKNATNLPSYVELPFPETPLFPNPLSVVADA